MEKIDLSILKKIPELNTKVILEIEPLAPLSMVSELPGSYYKTLKVPNKKMLCGLLENLLGWHIDLADRKAIVKELSKLREKQAKKDTSIKFEDKTKGSNYCPLLMDYFEINEVQPMFAKAVFYDDLWNKAFRRSDATGNQPTHAKGTINIDYSLIPIKRELPRDQKILTKLRMLLWGNYMEIIRTSFLFIIRHQQTENIYQLMGNILFASILICYYLSNYVIALPQIISVI